MNQSNLEAVVSLGNLFSVVFQGCLNEDGTWPFETELKAVDAAFQVVRKDVCGLSAEDMQIVVESIQRTDMHLDQSLTAVDVRLLVERPWESRVQVLVKARVAPELQGEAELLQAVIRAVSKWVRSSDRGAACWKYSSQDLNLGDLASHTDDPDLIAALEGEGIWKFRVEQLQGCTDWLYDTILVNENE